MKQLVIFLASLSLLCACSSSQPAANINDSLDTDLKKAQRIEESKNTVDLKARLKAYPGINVRGSGVNATFTIRGINSFSDNAAQPLFVLNGQQLSTYDQVYDAVDPTNIKKIEVLRKTTETRVYGFRGNAGVIRITTDRDLVPFNY